MRKSDRGISLKSTVNACRARLKLPSSLYLESSRFGRNNIARPGDIGLVHVPVIQKALWLYTDPEGEMALSVGPGTESLDELQELVLQQVPPNAEITGRGYR